MGTFADTDAGRLFCGLLLPLRESQSLATMSILPSPPAAMSESREVFVEGPALLLRRAAAWLLLGVLAWFEVLLDDLLGCGLLGDVLVDGFAGELSDDLPLADEDEVDLLL